MPAAAEPPAPSPRAGEPRAVEPLVERDRELASLAALLGDAAGGRAAFALIEGQAGIGKTRLLGELRALASDAGARLCSARASELERELPFGVVRQLFEPLAHQPGAERLLGGAAASALPVLTAVPDAGGEAPQDSSFAVLHGLYWLVVNLAAEAPLVLAIDDLHAADRPSLRFLAYLLRRVEDLPVLLAATLRASEPGTDPALLAELAHDPVTVPVRPGPLSAGGVAALVEARLGEAPDAAFRDACVHVTGGNPLLLRQLLAALAGDGVAPTAASARLVHDVGPRAVSRTVLLRLGRLPASATAVARALALLGESADVRILAALADLSEAEVGDATAALVRAEIVQPQPPLAFVHPLVRDAIHQELGAGERERRHARAAELLRDAGAPAEQVAQQLLAVPPSGAAWAVETLQEAGRSAMRKGAPDSAVTYLRRALDEPPSDERRAGLVFELGVTEALTSGPAATAHLREAYEAQTDPAARGQAAVVYARTLLFTGSARDAGELAQRAAAELPAELADLRQAIAAIAAISFSSGASDFATAREVILPYRDRREGDGPGAKMAAAMCAFLFTVLGELDAAQAVAIAREALAGGTLIPYDGNHVAVATGFTLALADEEEAVDAVAAMSAHAHRRGSLFGKMGASLWGGWVRLHRGELADAEEEVRASLEMQSAWQETGIGGAYATAFLGEILVERGAFDAARAVLDAPIAGSPDSEGMRFLQRSRIMLALAEGRAEDALALARAYGRRGGAQLHPAWEPWRSLQARALALNGHEREALALVGPELELARRWGAPGVVGATLRVRGEIAGEAGEADLREAVATLGRSTRRLERAKALAALGGLLRRSRRVTEAREPLREALALADACSADGLAAHVRAELYAAGARPRRDAIQGLDALTASERRVAERAAEGQSNREIAQALFVTPKTVEVHLTNAYRKLGVRSRRDLPGVFAPTP